MTGHLRDEESYERVAKRLVFRVLLKQVKFNKRTINKKKNAEDLDGYKGAYGSCNGERQKG